MRARHRTLRAIAEIARTTDRADFASRNPFPFLVEAAATTDDQPDRAQLQFSTIELSTVDPGIGALLNVAALADARVLAVVKRGSGAFTGMVFVGRADNNDLIQDDPAVSKFHAFFTKDPADDAYAITDAGSMNGTFVNGQRLEPHSAQRLTPGDVVSFGGAPPFRFQLPEMLHQLAVVACA